MNGHKWTEQETNFLIDNYNSKTIKEIAEELNMAFTTVKSRVQILRLRKTRVKKPVVMINFNEIEKLAFCRSWS